MPSYAMKIGEIELRSSKPITPEERERAIRKLRERDGVSVFYVGELEVILKVR